MVTRQKGASLGGLAKKTINLYAKGGVVMSFSHNSLFFSSLRKRKGKKKRNAVEREKGGGDQARTRARATRARARAKA